MAAKIFGAILQQCSKFKDYRHGIALHSHIIKIGFCNDLILCNHVLNMYTRCYDFDSAHKLFDHMPKRNIVSWSVMVAGYDQAGMHSSALGIFARMDLPGNEYVYASAISACASLLEVDIGRQVHACAIKNGCDCVSFVYNSLMSMYMKCQGFDDACAVFNGVSEPNLVSYNAMISGFAENSQAERSLELFRIMKRKGLCPDQFTFVAVLGICSMKQDICSGAGLYCQTIKLGLAKTAFLGNVILTMYSNCNLIMEVEKAFQTIEDKDLISWNTFLAACCHCGENYKALMVYKVMQENNEMRPDDYTIATLLAACAELGLVKHGGQIHAHLIRTKEDFDIGVSNAIINMYSKCGYMPYASHVFHCMLERNPVSWNTMIMALANHGQGKAAVELFEQMKSTGTLPDSVTLIGLLAACSHSGLVHEGTTYYNQMKDVYNIVPQVEHLSCFIDLLGRAGRLTEAEKEATTLHFGKDPVVLGSLLSSSRLHGDVAVGERVARRLLELEPTTSSPYVLLSSVYASDSRWERVSVMRNLLKESGVKKQPGRSWIELNGIVEMFTAGSFEHPRIVEIEETLRVLYSKTDFLPNNFLSFAKNFTEIASTEEILT